MNGQHFRAFLWLRWRLRVNQLQRAGVANAVILGILAVGVGFLSLGLFVGSLVLGWVALPEASPVVLLLVWDGMVVVFLFSWATGLLADLQRSEALSLDKFLHLPVSLTSAFLINYLSSLVSITLVLFAPAMLGLCIALAFTRGPALLVLFPLLTAFLFMVTAVTHQFRNWLAALMVNQRRRRTVMVLATLSLVLLAQLPNLVNLYHPWTGGRQGLDQQLIQEQAELKHSWDTGKITAEQFLKQNAERSQKHLERIKESSQQTWRQMDRTAMWVNAILPPGWLPLGARAAAVGNVLPGLLGTLGMTLIAALSLWRSYRTTLRLYRGDLPSGKRQPAVGASRAPTRKTSPLLEIKLPFVSEQASAVAAAGFRSLTRAPEAKMLFLTPIILMVVFGGLFLRQPMQVPLAVRPLLAFGATGMMLLSLVQIAGNQFGFDRSGFRVYVLCPASRKDVLLGKNLAIAPIALGMIALLVGVLQVLKPMRLDHFAAVFPQILSMLLVFFLLTNTLSILAPIAVAAGTVRMSNMKGVHILLHLLFVGLFPLVVAPALLPLGVELLLQWQGWTQGAPVCLLLSLLECLVVVVVYGLTLTWQGDLLQAREQKILENVTARAEG